MKINSLPAATWVAMLTTEISSGSAQMTHRGSYRVWARCYSSTGTPQFRFLWGVGSLSVPVTNDPVTLPGASAFYLLDLGEIRIDPPPVGTAEWFGAVQTYSLGGGDSASVDCLYLQPLDEAAGVLTYVYEPPVSSVTASGYATSVANDSSGGSRSWTFPGAAEGPPDGACSFSTATGANQDSEYLNASGYGFSVPTSATILGIEVSVSRYAASSVTDLTVELMKAGSRVGSNRAGTGQWPTSEAVATFGSSTDLWGTTWAPSDVNNSGFGVSLAALLQTSTSVADVDAIQITVYYELTTSGFTVSQDAVIYSDSTCEIRYDQMWREGPAGDRTVRCRTLSATSPDSRPAGWRVDPVRYSSSRLAGTSTPCPIPDWTGSRCSRIYSAAYIFRP